MNNSEYLKFWESVELKGKLSLEQKKTLRSKTGVTLVSFGFLFLLGLIAGAVYQFSWYATYFVMGSVCAWVLLGLGSFLFKLSKAEAGRNEFLAEGLKTLGSIESLHARLARDANPVLKKKIENWMSEQVQSDAEREIFSVLLQEGYSGKLGELVVVARSLVS